MTLPTILLAFTIQFFSDLIMLTTAAEEFVSLVFVLMFIMSRLSRSMD